MAGDRYITMLPDIELSDPLSDEDPPARLMDIDKNGHVLGPSPTVQHRAVLRKLCQAPLFGESTAAIEAAVEILQRLRAFDPKSERYLRLTEPDWGYLNRATDAGPGGLLQLNAILLPQVLPMLHAIKKASTSPPKVEEPKVDPVVNGAVTPMSEVAAA